MAAKHTGPALGFMVYFEFNPPYLCTRTIGRSALEAISLSFSFMELVYFALLFSICRVLWARFNPPTSPVNANPYGSMFSESSDKLEEMQYIQTP